MELTHIKYFLEVARTEHVTQSAKNLCIVQPAFSGFLFRRCRGLRPCVESGPEHEDSSLVLKWILGHFWSLPRGVSPRLERGHERALSFHL